jgi:hypothetical protein
VTPVNAYYTTRNRLRFMRVHAPSKTARAAFLAYFTITRTLTVLDYVRRGKWQLARWTVQGLVDHAAGRTGATRIARLLSHATAPAAGSTSRTSA